MKMIAFVGNSGSGKTRLIAQLIPEFKKRGLAVAVVKHCSHGFDLGGADKDSSQFLASGADGVALAAPGRTAVLENRTFEKSLDVLARERFGAADIVLIEGGKTDARLRKIEVLRMGFSSGVTTPAAELLAIVADYAVDALVPHFHPDNVQGIADWLQTR